MQPGTTFTHRAFTNTRWAVHWPGLSEQNTDRSSIPLEAKRLLRYDEGGGGQWEAAVVPGTSEE